MVRFRVKLTQRETESRQREVKSSASISESILSWCEMLDGGCVRLHSRETSQETVPDLGKFVRSWLGAKPIGQEEKNSRHAQQTESRGPGDPYRCGSQNKWWIHFSSKHFYLQFRCFQLEYCSNHFNTTRIFYLKHLRFLISLCPLWLFWFLL